MESFPAISIDNLSHSYGERQALSTLSFQVQQREIFGLLGPNGGGKTTLFRILATLLPVQQGSVRIQGTDIKANPDLARRKIGITFQSPSLDDRLTVGENLKHQGQLYGISGTVLKERIASLLDRLGMADRSKDKVATLSGGLKRRVEIAKGLLHSPQVLLLDEPTTGLDPGARHDVWRYLKHLQKTSEITILVTTHIMEEAERCDRLGILDRGQLVAQGTPEKLRESVGGDCLTIQTEHPDDLSRKIESQFAVSAPLVGDVLRIEREQGHELLRDLVATYPNDITSIALGKPTLEDVFIHVTGHQFWETNPEAEQEAGKKGKRSKSRSH